MNLLQVRILQNGDHFGIGDPQAEPREGVGRKATSPRQMTTCPPVRRQPRSMREMTERAWGRS